MKALIKYCVGLEISFFYILKYSCSLIFAIEASCDQKKLMAKLSQSTMLMMHCPTKYQNKKTTVKFVNKVIFYTITTT